MTRRLSGWRRALFGVGLYLPLAFLTARYVSGTTFYGEYLHLTGHWSVYLLLVVLAITPLRGLFPVAGLPRWLLLQRRDIGIAVFVYAAAHTVAYCLRLGVVGEIIGAAVELPLLTGWVAFFVFLALAISSNDISVRAMGSNWRILHRAVYPAAVLAALHWVLTAFDPAFGYGVLLVTLVLLVVRVRVRAD